MHLVDDIHTVFSRDGSKICLFTQIADVINAIVARRINLDHV